MLRNCVFSGSRSVSYANVSKPARLMSPLRSSAPRAPSRTRPLSPLTLKSISGASNASSAALIPSAPLLRLRTSSRPCTRPDASSGRGTGTNVTSRVVDAVAVLARSFAAVGSADATSWNTPTPSVITTCEPIAVPSPSNTRHPPALASKVTAALPRASAPVLSVRRMVTGTIPRPSAGIAVLGNSICTRPIACDLRPSSSAPARRGDVGSAELPSCNAPAPASEV